MLMAPIYLRHELILCICLLIYWLCRRGKKNTAYQLLLYTAATE